MTSNNAADPLAYGAAGYRCGCGMTAHSNLVPCQPDPLTNQQLDDIETRASAAAPGPWGSHRDLSAVYTVQARPRTTHLGMETDGDIATLAADRSDSESYANARFIAHAREDVPALVEDNRRLRAELDAANAQAFGQAADELEGIYARDYPLAGVDHLIRALATRLRTAPAAGSAGGTANKDGAQ